MPKWKSHLIREEKTDLGTGKKIAGIVAWEPLDDAAKASDVSDKGVEHGVYKRSSPTEKLEMQRKLEKKEAEAERGKIRL